MSDQTQPTPDNSAEVEEREQRGEQAKAATALYLATAAFLGALTSALVQFMADRWLR